MSNDKIIVRAGTQERHYVKVYHDFLDSELLDGKEKILFVLLKRYLSFTEEHGEVFPTQKRLAEQSGFTLNTVGKILKQLEAKGVIRIERQGLNKPNIYTIYDDGDMWGCKTAEEVTARTSGDLTEEERRIIRRLEKKGYKIEKEPTNAATVVSPEDHISINDCSKKIGESQYFPMDCLKILYDFEVMLHDHKRFEKEINAVMELLHDTLNSQKKAIRINGSDVPTQTVQSRLLKLDSETIIYSIEKFAESGRSAKNHKAYMLTILYNARQQMTLDYRSKLGND